MAIKLDLLDQILSLSVHLSPLSVAINYILTNVLKHKIVR